MLTIPVKRDEDNNVIPESEWFERCIAGQNSMINFVRTGLEDDVKEYSIDFVRTGLENDVKKYAKKLGKVIKWFKKLEHFEQKLQQALDEDDFDKYCRADTKFDLWLRKRAYI